MKVNRREFLFECIAAGTAVAVTSTVAQCENLLSSELKYFKGVELLRADVPNSNNRIYTKHVLESILNQFNENHSWVGMIGNHEFEHPENWQHPNTPLNVIKIKLAEVSHVVTNMFIEDDYLKADVRILETPQGKVLRNLASTSKIHFRTAGIGCVQDNVVFDYSLGSVNALLASEAAML